MFVHTSTPAGKPSVWWRSQRGRVKLVRSRVGRGMLVTSGRMPSSPSHQEGLKRLDSLEDA